MLHEEEIGEIFQINIQVSAAEEKVAGKPSGTEPQSSKRTADSSIDDALKQKLETAGGNDLFK
jgi:hypothetical protein